MYVCNTCVLHNNNNTLYEIPIIRMKIIKDILSTFLGYSEDNFETNEEDYSTNKQNDEYIGDEIACEQAIIKCRMKHGRLRKTTTKFCEKRFGKTTTKRTKWRLDMREKRGRNNTKEMISDITEALKPFWDSYLEQKKKDDFKQAI